MDRPINYRELNDALNQTLLGGRYANKPIYLSLGAEVREILAAKLGLEPDGIQSSITEIVGKSLDVAGDPYDGHLRAASLWRTLGYRSPPPFTAVLVALSFAAEQMAADGDFGAGNYYDRLANELQYPVAPLRFHGDSTEQFWLIFNRWLEKNDYEYGQPTARTFNSWKYVNYPQSQAIVRAGDRTLFHDLFERFGFDGKEEFSAEDIRPFLESWIVSSRSKNRLKAAWAKQELRRRVCEVAIAELQDWAGIGVTDGPRGQKRKQRLTAYAMVVQQFPRPKLSLYLGYKNNENLREISVLSNNPKFEGRLSNDVFGSVATISPNPMVSFPGVIGHGLEIKMPESETEAVWQPRLILPFTKSAEGPYLVEAARLSLGKNYMLLVRDNRSLRNSLDEYLNEASTGTARIANSENVTGIPPGWIIYNEVLLNKVIIPQQDNLKGICPLQDTENLQFEGGMSLAPKMWHSKAPPTIHFLGNDNANSISLHGSADFDSQEPKFEAFGRIASISRKRIKELGDGEYKVETKGASGYVSVDTLILRSASQPRPLHRQSEGKVQYCESAVSGSEFKADHQEPSVEGLKVSPSDFDVPEIQLPVLSTVIAAGEDEDIIQESGGPIGYVAEGEPSCVERGYHYYLCETLEPGMPKSTPLRGYCKDCGASFLREDGKQKKTAAQKKQKSVKPIPVYANNKPLSAFTASRVDHNLFLDALCFFGTGRIGKMESLLSSNLDTPAQVISIASNYSSLGLIDTMLDRGSASVRAWSVPVSTICFTSPSRAFLTGFRSTELKLQLQEAVAKYGGQIRLSNPAEMPKLIEILNLSPDELRLAIDGIEDPLGRAIHISVDGPARLASVASVLGYTQHIMEPMAVGTSGQISRYDCCSSRWVETTDTSQSGAYRLDQGRRLYCFVDENGNALRGPYQVVKLLAARQQEHYLHTYDRERKQFRSTLGAEPLGLLVRALVCCSGRLPKVSDGETIYSDVPEMVAAAVMHTMYEDRP